MKTLLNVFFLVFFASFIYGQSVGIGNSNPDNSAALDITSSDKGILIPRMDSLAMTLISSPAKGLMVFVNDKNAFYFYNSVKWQKINPGNSLLDLDEDTYVRVDNGSDNDEIDFYIKNNLIATIKTNTHGDFILDTKANNISNLFIGYLSGNSVSTGAQNTALGNGALSSLDSGSGNVAMGSFALSEMETAITNTAIGAFSMWNLKSGNENVGIGHGVLSTGDTLSSNTAIGTSSQQNASNTYYNTSIGGYALRHNKNSSANTAIGTFSLGNSQRGKKNTSIGHNSLRNNISGDANIAIGYEAGKDELGSNKLYIENSGSASPLIYGDFANDSVKIYGSLSVGEAYTFPTTDGNSNQILATDGLGQTYWKNDESGLVDGDGDTYVEVDNGTDNDEINFFLKSKKLATIKTNANEDFILDIPSSNASNLFIGNDIGSLTTGGQNTSLGNFSLSSLTTGNGNIAIGNATLASIKNAHSNVGIGNHSLTSLVSGGSNVGIGTSTLTQGDTLYNNTAIGFWSQYFSSNTFNNTTLGSLSLVNNSNASENVAIGAKSLEENRSGSYNTVIGTEAFRSNLTGSGNIAIGYQAGQDELGSNKLYIENSSSPTPLLYGDFANDSIKIYGSLSVGEEYTLPTTDGNLNQILSTNGLGQAYWKNEDIGLVNPGGDTYITVDDGTDNDKISMYSENINILNIRKDVNNAPIIETSADYLDFARSPFSPSAFKLELDFLNKEIKVGGSMGINTSNPSSIFHVKQLDSNQGIKIESASDSDNWNTYIDNANDYNFAYNGALKAYIQDSDGTYNVFSDRRLKKNIRKLDAILPKVLELEASKYVYKNDATENPQIGFMAQDVEVLFPEAVNEKNGFKSINYAVFGVLAIEAIKEQQVKIDELEAKVNQILALLKDKE